jgi:hypothetical protein
MAAIDNILASNKYLSYPFSLSFCYIPLFFFPIPLYVTEVCCHI